MILSIFIGIFILGVATVIICGAVSKFADNKYVGGTLLSVLAFATLIFSLVIMYQLGVEDTEIMYKEKIPTIEIQLADYEIEQIKLKLEEINDNIGQEEYIDN